MTKLCHPLLSEGTVPNKWLLWKLTLHLTGLYHPIIQPIELSYPYWQLKTQSTNSQLLPSDPLQHQPPTCGTVLNWITMQCTTEPNTPDNLQQQPHPLTNTQQAPAWPMTIQQPIHAHTDNLAWGDALLTHPHLFHILSQNINSIANTNYLLKWQGVSQALLSFHVDVACLQEINVNWIDTLHQQVCKLLMQTHQCAHLSISSSTKPSDDKYQPGGTTTIVLGLHTAWILSSGHDPSGMGWWSFVKLLGKNQQKIIIASAYHVCPQQAAIGSNMIMTQQTHIMICAGYANPTPCKQMLIYLVQQINTWTQMHHEVLVCMDLHEDTADPDPDTGISYILSHTWLIDLHWHHHPHTITPAIHNWGHLTINVCLSTKVFADAILGAWYLPFGILVTMTGNHRALGLDSNIDMLLGNKNPDPEPIPSHGVYSNDMPMVKKCNDAVALACKKQGLFTEINRLYCKYWFDPADHDVLEPIDCTLAQIMVTNGQYCQCRHHYPWSPELHYAYLTYRYWTIKLSEPCTHHDMSQALNNSKTISANLCPKTTPWNLMSSMGKHQEHLTSLTEAADWADNKQ